MAAGPAGEVLRAHLLTILSASDSPMTARDLRERLADEIGLDEVNEAVYRNLVVLARRGAINRLPKVGRHVQWQAAVASTPSRTPTAPMRAHSADDGPVAKRWWQDNPSLQASVDCIKIVRADGSLEFMNRSGCDALGVSAEQTGFGMPWLELLPSQVRTHGMRALQTALGGTPAHFAGLSIGSDDRPQFWDNLLTPILGDDGRIREVMCISRDVTTQLEAHHHLQLATEVDDLTGVWNRRSLVRHLTKVLWHANASSQSVGLMIFDLDHFKSVNDTLGHPAGDHLLKVVAERVRDCLANTRKGFLARLGGDEFAVVITDIANPGDLYEMAALILTQLHRTVSFHGHAIDVGMSIGAALYPRDAQDLPGLFQCAHTALTEFKSRRRGGIQVFTPHMAVAAEKRTAQLELARTMLREGTAVPYYQPRVRLCDRRLIGFEALLRWPDGAGGLHGPGAIDAAFTCHEVATAISDAMHTAVFADLASWLAEGLDPVPVAINTAPVDFLGKDFAQRLLTRLAGSGVPPALVIVEIDESAFAARSSHAVFAAVDVLRAAGVRIALDGFGSSSLSFDLLRRRLIDGLTLGQDLLHSIRSQQADAAIARSISQLGSELPLDPIAVGIEADADRHNAISAGFATGQGFLFGGPLDAAHARHELRDRPTRTTD